MLSDRAENIAGAGDMRQVDLGLDFFTGRPRRARSLACAVRFACASKVRTHFLGLVLFQGAGMRLLLRHTDFGEDVENRLALDLQFSRQIVNSNLAHPLPVSSRFPPNRS